MVLGEDQAGDRLTQATQALDTVGSRGAPSLGSAPAESKRAPVTGDKIGRLDVTEGFELCALAAGEYSGCGDAVDEYPDAVVAGVRCGSSSWPKAVVSDEVCDMMREKPFAVSRRTSIRRVAMTMDEVG